MKKAVIVTEIEYADGTMERGYLANMVGNASIGLTDELKEAHVINLVDVGTTLRSLQLFRTIFCLKQSLGFKITATTIKHVI